MIKDTKINVVLSKKAQTHIPGTIWSQDDPQINIRQRLMEDLVKRVNGTLKSQYIRYSKELDKMETGVENIRTSDEAYDETLDYVNKSLQEIDEELDGTFYDIFHKILELNARFKKMQPRR